MVTNPIGTLLCTVALAAGCGAEPAFRAAAILPSAADDHAFSQSMADSLAAEQRAVGDKAFGYTLMTNVAASAAEADLRQFANQGVSLAVAHGVQYEEAVRSVAGAFPAVSFAFMPQMSSAIVGIPNAFAYEARAGEGGYVNGVMAARLSGSGILGVVGPIETGDAKLYIDGFAAGAKATRADIDVRITYVGSFDDTSLAAQAAQAHMDAGADVLTGVGQLVIGAIDVAKAHHALWFGSQSDQAPLAPDIVVASEVYRWQGVIDQMRSLIQSGVHGGRAFSIDLANGGEVIVFNPAYPLPADVKALAEQTIQAIESGQIPVMPSQ